MIDSGIGQTIYKNGQNAVKLVKCIKSELAELAGQKKGAAAKTAVVKVVDEAVPEMIDALGAATGGISEAALEVFNAAKVAWHIDYLYSYYKKKDYTNIGWEMGAIAYDITQAIEGKSSVTIEGETFDFIDTKVIERSQQRRSLASSGNHDEEISQSSISSFKNLGVTKGPTAHEMYIKAFYASVDPFYYDKIANPKCFKDEKGYVTDLLSRMNVLDTLYKERTVESITQAVQVEAPKVNDIVLDFADSMCGRSVFSHNATLIIEESNKILKSANISVIISNNTKIRPLVHVNGIDISSYLGIQGYYYKVITEAQASG